MGTVEEAEKIRDDIDGDRDRTKARPADVTRQREILARPQLEERQLAAFGATDHAPSVRHVKNWVS